ncbi:NTP transferase domain-containing protein [Parapedobacter sp.]
MISKDNPPLLNGLVLAGGKSRRMGHNKGRINWHGKQQRFFAADLLKPFCENVFISYRHDALEGVAAGYNALADTFLGMGPLGGILSALRSDREKAWLVVACDLPLLDRDTLRFLIADRLPAKVATAYESPLDGLPEPLIAIWEPKSYPVLLHFLGEGITCPRKVLINADTHLVKPRNPDALLNVNTPDDAATAREIMQRTAGNPLPKKQQE